jgi:hypothetical protein
VNHCRRTAPSTEEYSSAAAEWRRANPHDYLFYQYNRGRRS